VKKIIAEGTSAVRAVSKPALRSSNGLALKVVIVFFSCSNGYSHAITENVLIPSSWTSLVSLVIRTLLFFTGDPYHLRSSMLG